MKEPQACTLLVVSFCSRCRYNKQMISLFIFLLGLAVGSFLNAVIFRLEKGENALKGRSYCPQCKHQLSFDDLIPVLSFVLLKGKCRYCKKPISWQYPLVEISTAAVFLLIFFTQGLNFYLWSIASLLIVIFVYDLKYYLIPDIILYLAIGVAFLYRIFKHVGSLENALVSAIFASAFFLAIYLLSKGKWMGFGDVKLAFFMGLFLGFPNILIALYSAFFAGAVVGVVLIVAKKKKMNSQVPFGPFLVGGTFFALLFGQSIAHWYLRFLLV